MRRALELADSVKGTTHPNPAVGAVVESDGRVVGEGATSYCGGPHAERHALLAASGAARGGTLYVTLEPCCHFGRTPPCTDAIIEAGIRRVVVGVGDANPLVRNKGIARLRRRGITVQVGLLRDEAYRLNEDYFWSLSRQSSWVTLKLAMTLDGRIADERGTSKWITTEPTRKFVHELRRKHAGIAVGAGTLRADNPELTVRLVQGVSPVRFVICSSTKVPPKSKFVGMAKDVRSVVVVLQGKKQEKKKREDGVEVWHTGAGDPVSGMHVFLKMAFEEGISSVMVEGGSQLASFLLENNFVNRAHLCYGNKIIGAGLEGIRFSSGLQLAHAQELQYPELEKLGSDFVVSGTFPREV